MLLMKSMLTIQLSSTMRPNTLENTQSQLQPSILDESLAQPMPSYTSRIQRFKKYTIDFILSLIWLVICIILCIVIAKIFENVNQNMGASSVLTLILNLVMISAIFLILSSSVENKKIEWSFKTARRQISVAVAFILLNEYLKESYPVLYATVNQVEFLYVAFTMFILSLMFSRDEQYKLLGYITTSLWVATFGGFQLFVILTFSHLADGHLTQSMISILQSLSEVVKDLL